jgi:hypothetical protein
MFYIYTDGPTPRVVIAQPREPQLCVGIDPAAWPDIWAYVQDYPGLVQDAILHALRTCVTGLEHVHRPPPDPAKIQEAMQRLEEDMLRDVARRVETGEVVLSPHDQQTLLDALEHPPDPNAAL